MCIADLLRMHSQMKVTPVKVFVIHIEVITADLNVHRVSISPMYSHEGLRVRLMHAHASAPQRPGFAYTPGSKSLHALSYTAISYPAACAAA